MTKPSVRRQVASLLGLLAVGVCSGVLLTGYFLYHHNPSGRYLAENVLLAPTLVENLSFSEKTPERGQQVRYLFDALMLSYYDRQLQRTVHYPLTLEKYTDFYGWLVGDVSLESVDEVVRASFDTASSTNITLNVRSEHPQDFLPPTVVFQAVTLAAQGGYYRIQLHTSNTHTAYAYFRHPGLEQQVWKLVKRTRG